MAPADSAPSVPAGVPVLEPEAAAAFVREGEEKEERTAREIEGRSNEEVLRALTESLSGRSNLVYQEGHGVFVEYTAPDGQLRMWYPNNVRVVRGSWGVRQVRGRARACFRYVNAVNPVTQVFEPTECVSAVQSLSGANVLRSWPGDVFGLMEDRIPYRKTSMDMPSPELLGEGAASSQP
jgi:hypothetical protein